MTYSYADLLSLFGIGGAHPGGLALTRAILDELPIDQDTFFLEVGCGTGQTTSFIMLNHPCKLYAIDNDPLMIHKVKNRLQSSLQEVELLEASAEEIPFQDQMFRYVLSESVTVFTNIRNSLKEYSRVLIKNGELILVEMIEEQFLSEDEANELIEFYNLNQLLTEDKWVALLKDTGFSDIKAYTIKIEELHRDEHDFTEFDLSDNLDPELFSLLERHEQLTQQYKDKLGFRVFICKKS